MNTPSSFQTKLPRFIYITAIANLIAQVGIIVTGGLVRLTGSGLGCSTWPMCEPGQFAPVFHSEMTYHPIIEFGNRTLTGVLGVIAVALVVLVFMDKTTNERTRVLSWLPLAGVAVQALIGGITVLLHLHPAIVGFHMMISVALVLVSTVVVYRVSPKNRANVESIPVLVKRVIAVLMAWMLPIVFLGVIVTGAGPHSGDETVGYRWAIDPMSAARVHAFSVWVFVALLALLGYLMYRNKQALPASLFRGFWWVVAITAVQGLIGYWQTFNGLPWVVVTFHLLGIGAFTIVMTRLWLLSRKALPARNTEVPVNVAVKS